MSDRNYRHVRALLFNGRLEAKRQACIFPWSDSGSIDEQSKNSLDLHC